MKKMMAIKVECRKDRNFLVFETENYYRRPTRKIDMECFYDDFSKAALIKNANLYESTIRDILLCLFTSMDKHNFQVILYPHFRNRNRVLRIDTEEPLFDLKRNFCAELELPSCDFLMLDEDFEFKSKIARIILNHLPMKDFFQETPIVELDFDEAMRKYGSANIWDHRKPTLVGGLDDKY